VWYLGRSPRQQPKVTPCDALLGQVPRGTFVLYNDRAWDTNYDWQGHSRNHPGTVPDIVLKIMASLGK
jgi:hypothetical protein